MSSFVIECVTSDDAEQLLDPHVDVDPAEKLVHVTPPLLQEGAGGGGVVSVGITGKDFTEPPQHQLQPLRPDTEQRL